MTRAGLLALFALAAGVAVTAGVVGVRAATGDAAPQEAVPAKPRTETLPGDAGTEAVPAKPRTEEPPEPTEMPEIVPPPTLPDVDIPPIPEVDDDPFKAGAPPERKGPSGLLAEGKRLFNCEGRLETDRIGRSLFVFDSGQPPMYLLENSWRQFLERRTEYGKKFARWRVSGLVTVYGKQNYLLLTKCVRIEAEEDQL
ncbi:MAG: hypothetical protein R6X20_03700 [Phycisphaerae bacterium]